MKLYGYFGFCIVMVALIVVQATVAMAASDTLTSMCNSASGTVREQIAPQYYLESVTTQAPEARLRFEDGSVYRFDNFLSSDWSGDQKAQADRLKDMGKLAFLTQSRVSLCVGTGTSPNTIWILELSNP